MWRIAPRRSGARHPHRIALRPVAVPRRLPRSPGSATLLIIAAVTHRRALAGTVARQPAVPLGRHPQLRPVPVPLADLPDHPQARPASRCRCAVRARDARSRCRSTEAQLPLRRDADPPGPRRRVAAQRAAPPDRRPSSSVAGRRRLGLGSRSCSASRASASPSHPTLRRRGRVLDRRGRRRSRRRRRRSRRRADGRRRSRRRTTPIGRSTDGAPTGTGDALRRHRPTAPITRPPATAPAATTADGRPCRPAVARRRHHRRADDAATDDDPPDRAAAAVRHRRVGDAGRGPAARRPAGSW